MNIVYNTLMDYIRALKPGPFKIIISMAVPFFTFLYIYYTKTIEEASPETENLLIINLLKSYIDFNTSVPLKFAALFSFWFAVSAVIYFGIWLINNIFTRIQNAFIIRFKYTNLK